jgi:hypothetical protein
MELHCSSTTHTHAVEIEGLSTPLKRNRRRAVPNSGVVIDHGQADGCVEMNFCHGPTPPIIKVTSSLKYYSLRFS